MKFFHRPGVRTEKGLDACRYCTLTVAGVAQCYSRVCGAEQGVINGGLLLALKASIGLLNLMWAATGSWRNERSKV